MTFDEPFPTELQSSQARRIQRWGGWYLALLLVGLAALLGRVVQLKVAPNERLQSAVGSSLSSRVELTRRGDLLDRCGRVIATSTVGFRLFVDPGLVEDVETLAFNLANLIDVEPADVERKIASRANSRYVVIDQHLEAWQVEALRRGNLRGVGIEPRLVRHYPHVDLAAGVVGKVGFEHTGQGGFELIFNRDMTASLGKLTFLRDVRRQALWIDPDDYEPGRDGESVRLSIDLVIQEFAEKRLRRAMEEFNAAGGRIIVADPLSGDVLAMADFLNPARADDPELTNDPLRKIHPALGRNRCVTDPYEPGSTFKPFVWAVATEMKKSQLDEILPTPYAEEGGWRTPYGRWIRDTHFYGPVSWRTVLVKSMNTGMAMIAERMSHRDMQSAIRRFGFGRKTSCGLPGESAGIMTSPRKWKTYTQSSVSMGHEIAVTPVQMVRAFSAFCRDGSLMNLRLTIDDSRLSSAAKSAIADQSSNRSSSMPVISSEIVAITRDAMRSVMEEGTGRAAQSSKYTLFGKSGTAQLPRRDRKGYHQDRYVSSFIAAAPYHHPQIIVLCVLDDPDRRRGHFGGAIAGPVVRDVIDESLNYLGVPADKTAAPRSAYASAN